MVDEAEAQRALAVAAADAAVDVDQVLFFPFGRDPLGRINHASLIPPGDGVSEVQLELLKPSAASEIVRQTQRHRLTCWLGVDERGLAPILRHELEHLLQWRDAGGRPTMHLATGVLYPLLDRVGYGRLRFNGQVYNLNPIELDANGAASRLSRRLLGNQVAEDLARELDPALFRRRPPPEPRSTLRTRLVCHAAAWGTEIEGMLRGAGYEPADWFERRVGHGELWSQLMLDDVHTELRKAVLAAKPTEESISNADTPEEAWKATRDAVLVAVDHARAYAGLPATPR